MNQIDIFPWNDSFDTGLPEIDEQHRRLVQLLNTLASHIASGRGRRKSALCSTTWPTTRCITS